MTTDDCEQKFREQLHRATDDLEVPDSLEQRIRDTIQQHAARPHSVRRQPRWLMPALVAAAVVAATAVFALTPRSDVQLAGPNPAEVRSTNVTSSTSGQPVSADSQSNRPGPTPGPTPVLTADKNSLCGRQSEATGLSTGLEITPRWPASVPSHRKVDFSVQLSNNRREQIAATLKVTVIVQDRDGVVVAGTPQDYLLGVGSRLTVDAGHSIEQPAPMDPFRQCANRQLPLAAGTYRATTIVWLDGLPAAESAPTEITVTDS
ncbi:MAG: hypothetical protein WKF57_04180 [Nakamurella sp.]